MHTPGPWYSCPMHRVYSEHPQASVTAVAQCETAGNASLVAAAPDLLAALRIAYARLDSLGAEQRPQLFAELNQISDAIAKAEGRS